MTSVLSKKEAEKQLERLIGPTKHRGGKSETTKGVSYTGSAAQNFTKFLKQYGIRYVCQDDGIVRIAERDKASAQFPTSIVLSAETGLIGIPSIGENGVLSGTALLTPGLKPFRQVEIQGVGSVDGSYVVEKVKHRGRFFGSEWYSEFEAISIS